MYELEHETMADGSDAQPRCSRGHSSGNFLRDCNDFYDEGPMGADNEPDTNARNRVLDSILPEHRMDTNSMRLG